MADLSVSVTNREVLSSTDRVDVKMSLDDKLGVCVAIFLVSKIFWAFCLKQFHELDSFNNSKPKHFNNSTIQQFNNSTIQEFDTFQQFNHSTNQQFSNSTIQQFNHQQFKKKTAPLDPKTLCFAG